MKSETVRRWLIRSVVVGALVFVGVWVARNTYWKDVEIQLPLHGAALTDSQYALKVFLRELRLRVESGQALGALPPPNAVIILNEWHWDLIAARQQRLEEWVRGGGRLVVDLSLFGVYSGFQRFSGIEHQVPPRRDRKTATEDEETDESKQPDEEDCKTWTVAVDSRGASAGHKEYVLCDLPTGGWLASTKTPLWAVRDAHGIQAMRQQIGQGSVTVINTMPFDNWGFRGTERGAFLAAAAELRHDDEVWLLTEAEHASLLTLVWSYGWPVVALFALFVVVACWRTAVRFGPLAAPAIAPRRSLAEQIRGTGWFILRLGGARVLYGATLRAVNEAASRRVARFASLTREGQVAALIAHTGIDDEKLKQAWYPAGASGGVTRRQSRQHLYQVIATLETVRRALLHAKPIAIDQTTSSAAREASHAS